MIGEFPLFKLEHKASVNFRSMKMLPIQAMVMDISITVGCFNGARLFDSIPIVRRRRFLKINFIDYLL